MSGYAWAQRRCDKCNTITTNRPPHCARCEDRKGRMTRRSKYVGNSPETVAWITDQLGIDPKIVSHIRIDIDVTQAATITVDTFARTGDLDALVLEDVKEIVYRDGTSPED